MFICILGLEKTESVPNLFFSFRVGKGRKVCFFILKVKSGKYENLKQVYTYAISSMLLHHFQ